MSTSSIQFKGYAANRLQRSAIVTTTTVLLNLFLGTFQLFMGNIGFSSNKTHNKGWGSLKNLKSAEIDDLYSSLSKIEDLVRVFLVFVGKNTFNDYQVLKPFYLPLSYPDGKCFSFEFKRDDSIPLELGIEFNKTLMKQNNIRDMDVFFKDPINSVGFISSKV